MSRSQTFRAWSGNETINLHGCCTCDVAQDALRINVYRPSTTARLLLGPTVLLCTYRTVLKLVGSDRSKFNLRACKFLKFSGGEEGGGGGMLPHPPRQVCFAH